LHPLIPCTERVIFPLGKLPVVPDWLNIHGFGVMAAIGLWLGGNMAMRKAQRDGLDPKIISEIIGWIVVGIFVGGHLGHLLFYEPKEFLRDPLIIFKVWDGLSSFGGFIACTGIVIWIVKSKNDTIRRENVKRKEAGTPLQPLLPLLGYGDSLLYGLTLGFCLGRFGCFLAHDHPGIATDFWLGVYGICPPQHTPLCQSVGMACHDLGLYECIWAGIMTLISVALTMAYLCLDIFGKDWHFNKSNKRFQLVFALWIAVPALLTPFWAAPALLKAITAMVGNLLLAPAAVAVIFYFVNRPSMGELKAGAGRNLLLGTTLAFALTLAVIGVMRLLA